MKTVIFFLALLLAYPVLAAEIDQPLAGTGQEARAVALGEQLRCVVCQSESINDSQASMARDLRQLVREKIAEGWSDDQILIFLRQRYGDFILLRPPVQTNTLALWICPILFVIGGGMTCVLLFRKRNESGEAP